MYYTVIKYIISYNIIIVQCHAIEYKSKLHCHAQLTWCPWPVNGYTDGDKIVLWACMQRMTVIAFATLNFSPPPHGRVQGTLHMALPFHKTHVYIMNDIVWCSTM